MVPTMESIMEMIKKVLLCFLCILLISGCSKKKEEEALSEDSSNGVQQEEIVNEPAVVEDENEPMELYAIFGVDSRSNSYGIGTRSDCLMIVGIDNENKLIKVCSILRDTLFNIEGHGYEKATHAHSYGGPKLAVSTLNENLDLNIEKYITVNFNSVADLVDMIGGVTMEVNADEVLYINGYIDENNKVRGTSSEHITEAGTYNLDGSQAVAYSRIRYTEGGDFKRSERQRDVLFEIFEEAKDLGVDTKLQIAKSMLNTISTNIPEDEVLELLNQLSSYEIEDMVSYPQIFYAGLINTRYVEVPWYLTDMCEAIHEYFGFEGYEPSETVLERSEYVASLVDGPNTDTSELYGNEQ